MVDEANYNTRNNEYYDQIVHIHCTGFIVIISALLSLLAGNSKVSDKKTFAALPDETGSVDSIRTRATAINTQPYVDVQ